MSGQSFYAFGQGTELDVPIVRVGVPEFENQVAAF